MPETTPSPTARAPRATLAARWRGFAAPPRVVGVDLARSLAIIGMIGAHMGSVVTGDTGDVVWSDPGTWLAVIHGRSAILFAVLAGVSLALMSGGTTPPTGDALRSTRLRLVGRGLAVFAIGLVLEYLGTPIAVILTVWGVMFVLATTFIHWRVRTLLIVAGALAVAGPPLVAIIQFVTLGPSFGAGSGLVQGIYPLTVWLAFVFAGLAVGRLGLGRMKVAVSTLAIGVGLAVAGYSLSGLAYAGAFGAGIRSALESFGSSMSSSLSGSSSIISSSVISSSGGSSFVDAFPGGSSGDYLERLGQGEPLGTLLARTLDAAPHSGGIGEIVGSGGFALAVLGLCLLIGRWVRIPVLPLIALGSMPLTAYTVHVLVFVVVAGGPGGMLEPSVALWLITVGAITVACTIWALTLGRGPLERLTARAANALASAPPERT